MNPTAAAMTRTQWRIIVRSRADFEGRCVLSPPPAGRGKEE